MKTRFIISASFIFIISFLIGCSNSVADTPLSINSALEGKWQVLRTENVSDAHQKAEFSIFTDNDQTAIDAFICQFVIDEVSILTFDKGTVYLKPKDEKEKEEPLGNYTVSGDVLTLSEDIDIAPVRLSIEGKLMKVRFPTGIVLVVQKV